jgi:putative ABC transport system substrate-binding protein
MVRRRELILGGAILLGPAVARAQQTPMPVIGFLHSGLADQNVERVAAYRKGLHDSGFDEGRNVAIEFRWASGDESRLSALAEELVRRRVAVIATPGSTPAALAAKAATSEIPIVFATGADPIKAGLVAGLARPGGNATGSTSLNPELAAKRLELMQALVPQISHCIALMNPTSILAEPFAKGLAAGAARLGLRVETLEASTVPEIDAAFARLPQAPETVLIVSTDVFFYNHRSQLATLAAERRVPAIYDNREYVDAGGLISYGADFLVTVEQAGRYTGRILKGEKPADLPVVRSAKFQLVINLKAAKSLGLTVPQLIFAQADEIIE